MSFSNDVKRELEAVLPNARHCQLAELSALNSFGNRELSETSPAGRKVFTLRKKTSMIKQYVETILKNSCCKRAYVRGAFLCVGSVIDPAKGYDLEFVCDEESKAMKLSSIISEFNVDARITKRKNSYVLYIKDAEGVVDTLNVMGAHNSLMELENHRVEKDFRNLLNRKVNCEAANIIKVANASTKQISDIQKIEQFMGLSKLPLSLKEVALVRLEYPDLSLSELGKKLDPPVSKSGINHRLRRISEIADAYQKE